MAKVAEDSSARVDENNADKDGDIDIKDEEILVKNNLCPICKVSYQNSINTYF